MNARGRRVLLYNTEMVARLRSPSRHTLLAATQIFFAPKTLL
jgi:hypothetical protein